MANITAQMVKDLRETSGAGMMDCKKALTECNGNMEEASQLIEQYGIIPKAAVALKALPNCWPTCCTKTQRRWW